MSITFNHAGRNAHLESQGKAFLAWYKRYVRSWTSPDADPMVGYPPHYIEVAMRAFEAGAAWRASQPVELPDE